MSFQTVMISLVGSAEQMTTWHVIVSVKWLSQTPDWYRDAHIWLADSIACEECRVRIPLYYSKVLQYNSCVHKLVCQSPVNEFWGRTEQLSTFWLVFWTSWLEFMWTIILYSYQRSKKWKEHWSVILNIRILGIEFETLKPFSKAIMLLRKLSRVTSHIVRRCIDVVMYWTPSAVYVPKIGALILASNVMHISFLRT